MENQGLLYGEAYYRNHCGPVPYGRAQVWLQFFGQIAEHLIQVLKPASVLDAGCAWGLLVEAFRDRGVEAWGVDVSSYAIQQVRSDLQPFCRIGSLADSFERKYDLITCIEVLEHMQEDEAELAMRNLCGATDTILFSSSPSDLAEPTHVNVRPVLSWLLLFAAQGFAPDLLFDASFVAPHAFLLRRTSGPVSPDALALFAEKLRLRTELSETERQRDEWMREAEESAAWAKVESDRAAALYASPAWRTIQRYRQWLGYLRKRHPQAYRLMERVAGRVLGETRNSAKTAVTQVSKINTREKSFSYGDWIVEHDPNDAEMETQKAMASSLPYRPIISIVVPVFRVPFAVVDAMIASVLAQTYPNWELCMAHADVDAPQTREHLAALTKNDQRIKVLLLDENRGISENSNQALRLATGEFLALLDHDDTLAPFALFEVAKALNENRNADFIYSDRDELVHQGNNQRRVNPLYKPQWSPEILLSANYLTHFCVMRTKHVQAAGGWRADTDGAQDWDLFLRVTEAGGNVLHIPKVLYHWRQIETSVAGRGMAAKPYASEAQLKTVRDHLRRKNIDAEPDWDRPNVIRIRWNPRAQPGVSVILVSSAPDADAVERARQALSKTTGPLREIVPTTAGQVQRAVEDSTGEVLVLLDVAAEPVDGDWLTELCGPLSNKEIGIVGAKLLKPGTSIMEHAGIVIAGDGRLEYPFQGEHEHVSGEFGAACWYRNWSAVSGAALSIRRETWEAVGGFSTELQYPRLDVDLCLRVRFRAGLRIVYNPFARFFQHKRAAAESWVWSVSEQATRRYVRTCFPEGDPYFHPSLICREGKVRLRSRTGTVADRTVWERRGA